MSVRWFSILGGLALATITAGSIALAASSPTIESTPAPKPAKPDFSAMMFLNGSWTCSTKSARRPAPYITTNTTSIDPSGYWQVTKSTVKAMAWFPYPTQGTDWVTYDSSTNRWVDVFQGDFGGYGVSTSPGWSGDSSTWTDALFKPGTDIIAEKPVVTTKNSATKTTSISSFQEKSSGRWIDVTTVCTKSS